MSEKNIQSRIINKHDTESNFLKATGFIPKAGELVVYDKDDTHDYERLKIGDGVTVVSSLPFASSTNDYTTDEKTKLAGIEEGANKTIIDGELSSTSTNPVQNKIVTGEINSIKTLVGDTSVAEQITSALSGIEPGAEANVQVNWTEADTSSDAYILNKPAISAGSASASIQEGWGTTASAEGAHAEGYESIASGHGSHAEGRSTASGDKSHAEGYFSVASGDYSHSEGFRTIAKGDNQHVQGKYNIEDTGNKYAHIVGNGYYDSDNSTDIRSNAHTLDWDGNAWFAGDVYVGGTNQNNATKLATAPKITTISIPAASWTGNAAPYSQVVTVNGVTANSKVDLQPTATQIIALQDADIMLMTENNDGVVTVYAIGGVPISDYTMQALITEVVVV